MCHGKTRKVGTTRWSLLSRGNGATLCDTFFFLKAQMVKIVDFLIGISRRLHSSDPSPLMSANVCNWVPPPPLKIADVLCGWPLAFYKSLQLGLAMDLINTPLPRVSCLNDENSEKKKTKKNGRSL